jgi:hypothetical protein
MGRKHSMKFRLLEENKKQMETSGAIDSHL